MSRNYQNVLTYARISTLALATIHLRYQSLLLMLATLVICSLLMKRERKQQITNNVTRIRENRESKERKKPKP